MQLDITTNGTKFTNDFLDKILQFKQLRLRISVDGTKDVYEYIRYPFPWKVFNKSIENLFTRCKDIRGRFEKVWIGFSIVALIAVPNFVLVNVNHSDDIIMIAHRGAITTTNDKSDTTKS